MSEAQNTKLVQDAYAAFGRGDIAALLNTFADDIAWRPVIGTAAHVPFSGERRGKAGAAEFFKIVGDTETFDQFEPREFVAQGETVVAIGHYRATAKATGRTFDSDFVMIFGVKNGKIATFREYTDTAAVNAAF
ncbi:MAG TPA: nuclear transport factor 2 family protein [Vicinamibacterales bacterium]|nr:nuclear transport factor 2 family protein [Vicinamibacterales bacterium]